MKFIGRNRRQGISEIQERLGYLARTIAEDTYMLLLAEGRIVEEDYSVYLDEAAGEPDELMRSSRISQVNRTNKTAMMRRRSVSAARNASNRGSATTRSRQSRAQITALNYISEKGSDEQAQGDQDGQTQECCCEGSEPAAE